MVAPPSITTGQLAKQVDGVLEGDASFEIMGISNLKDAEPNAVSWVTSSEYLEQASQSKAGALLIAEKLSLATTKVLIRVANPNKAIAKALNLFAPGVEPVTAGVHATAVISPDARIDGAAVGPHVYVGPRTSVGKGTQLHAGCYVGADVTIGEDSVIWPGVVIRERVSIGRGVVIHPNATIGADGFGYFLDDGTHAKIPQIGTVLIEDDVEIGANTSIDRAKTGATRIGRGTKIDNCVQIGHNVQVGEHCIIVAQCGIGGSADLGNYTVLAGQVAIVEQVQLHSCVQVAAKSLVTHDVREGEVVRGIPAIDNSTFLREQASLRKLQKWKGQLRDLAQRIEQIEIDLSNNNS